LFIVFCVAVCHAIGAVNGAARWDSRWQRNLSKMELLAKIINAIHDECLLLMGTAFLVDMWLLLRQLLALV
jgi:hypothetical protein